nr:cell wall-binding repeat-containing protein [Agromyces salentinus]
MPSQAAAAADAGRIEGVVTDSGGIPIAQESVVLHGYTNVTAGSTPSRVVDWTLTDASGAYQFAEVPAGTYTLSFECARDECERGMLDEWWSHRPDEQRATRFTLTAGQIRDGMNAKLWSGATISGTVTDTSGRPIGGVAVSSTPALKDGSPSTQADGTYALRGLWPGVYTLKFVPPDRSGFLAESWNDVYEEYMTGDLIHVTGTDISGIDGQLAIGGSISGVVRDESGSPVDAWIELEPDWAGSPQFFGPSHGSDGYLIGPLPPGRYRVWVHPYDDVLEDEWWKDAPASEVASWIELSEGRKVTGIDATVSSERTTLSEPAITGTVQVGVSAAVVASSTTPGATLDYQWFAGGTAIPGATSRSYVPKPSDVGLYLYARVIARAAGYAPIMKESAFSGAVSRVSRISGADRYSIAAAVSKATFAAGVATAYVASGENSTDGLIAAAAAGASGSPLLYSTRDTIPAAVLTELKRLRPNRIVVIGSTSSVGSAVSSKLAALTPGADERLAGTDPYSTAVAVSKARFSSGQPVVYVTGTSDLTHALTAPPITAGAKAPLLLTARDSIPPSVLTEIRRLRPSKIIVLGGAGAVSSVVASKLTALTPGADARIAGTDRYASSALLSSSKFGAGVPIVYVASGSTPQLAFAASTAGARLRGPVLLTQADQVPKSIIAELKRLKPGRIVIVGPTGSVNDSVRWQLEALK